MNAFAKGAGIQDLEQLDNRGILTRNYIIFKLTDCFLPHAGWVPSDIANVFVANHDTERVGCTCITLFLKLTFLKKGTSLNNNSQSNTYELAMIFSL